MRKLIVITGILMVGCATKPSTAPHASLVPPGYIDKPASIMAYQHPAMADFEPGFYNREAFAPGAFVAFEQPALTIFQIQTDDRLEGEDGWMYRRAMTQRIGLSVR